MTVSQRRSSKRNRLYGVLFAIPTLLFLTVSRVQCRALGHAASGDGFKTPIDVERSAGSDRDRAQGGGELELAPRKLKGRFIHITDMHPDPYYRFNSSELSDCHSMKPRKGKKGRARAGWWGTGVSDCDSPTSLINATFDWLKENWAGEVDFIVWTGDSARHDRDSDIPRSQNEIFDLNRWIVGKMTDTFGKDVPIVPSMGNNDIYPHNIMYGGPTDITYKFSNIWSSFIPEDNYHTFVRGAYYVAPVIPSRLSIISLNTLFFYDSNKAVDGCPPTPSHSNVPDPGTEELNWLKVQLERLRAEGQQVVLIGHVPPSPGNYYRVCYERYVELSLAFQDTIIGHFFGHMDFDHFFWLDWNEHLPNPLSSSNITNNVGRETPLRFQSLKKPAGDRSISIQTIDDDLLADYRSLPKRSKLDLDDYAVVNVAPSLIPAYFPGIRVFTYNVTEGEDGSGRYVQKNSDEGDVREVVDEDDIVEEEEEDEDEDGQGLLGLYSTLRRLSQIPFLTSSTDDSDSDSLSTLRRSKKKKGSNRRKHGHRHDPSKKKPPPSVPRHTSPDSPSRTNRYLSLLGFTQWYLDIDAANLNDGFGPDASAAAPTELDEILGMEGQDVLEDDAVGLTRKEGKGKKRPNPIWRVEYTTYTPEKLVDDVLGRGEEGVGPRAFPQERLVPEELRRAFREVLSSGGGGGMGEDEIREKVLELFKKEEKKKGKGKGKKDRDGHGGRIQLTPYGMGDLCIGKWLDLARKLAKKERDWEDYVHRIFVSSGAEFD